MTELRKLKILFKISNLAFWGAIFLLILLAAAMLSKMAETLMR